MASEIIEAQTSGGPTADGLVVGSSPLIPSVSSASRFAHFPEEVYDLSAESHLVRFLKVLVGDAGAGQLRKRYTTARLQQTLQGAHFYDLDRFYGALFGARRTPDETLLIDPYRGNATASEWSVQTARDASYRSRMAQLGRALQHGPTPTGIELAAEALLSVDCDVYESYIQADGSYQTYGELEALYGDAWTPTAPYVDTLYSTNRLLNPSFEVNSTTGMQYGTAVTGSRATTSSGVIGPSSGAAFLAVTGGASPTTSQSFVLQWLDGAVNPGEFVSTAVRARRSGTGISHMQMTIQFWDATTSLSAVSSPIRPLTSDALSSPDGLHTFVSPVAAPAGTTRARIVLFFSKSSAGTVAGDPGFAVHLDSWTATTGTPWVSAQDATQIYFDGSTVGAGRDLYAWTGTPGISSSTWTRRTSTAYPDNGTYAGMEGKSYAELEGAALARQSGDNRRIFIVRPKRRITQSEAYELGRVLDRIKPVDSRWTIDFSGSDPYIEVQPRGAFADSENWEVISRVSTRARDEQSSPYQVNSITPVEQPRPAFSSYQGEAWSHSNDIIGVAGYRQDPSAATPSSARPQQVVQPDGSIQSFPPVAALSPRRHVLAGRAASDGILVSNPAWGAAPLPGDALSPLLVDGMDLDALNALLATSAVDALPQNPEHRLWATPERPKEDQTQDMLAVSLTQKRLVNYVTAEVSRFPHRMLVQWWDGNSWQTAATREVYDSMPQYIPPARQEFGHPHHNFASHWVKQSFKFSAPVETTSLRFVLVRLADGAAPRGNATDEIPYSLALRSIDLGYRVHSLADVPAPALDGSTPIGTSVDILGSPIEYHLRSERAEGALDDTEAQWVSEPQPVNYAVVNFFLDTRAADGDAQVIDRFFLHPTHPGAAMNIYTTEAVPPDAGQKITYTNSSVDPGFQGPTEPYVVATNLMGNAQPFLNNGGAGFEVRRNYALRPVPTSQTSFLYQNGTGESSTSTLITGATDGPVVADPAQQITSYLRRTITTTKTAGANGFYQYTASPVTAPQGAKGVTSIWIRSSHDTSVRMLATWRDEANVGVGESYGPVTFLPAGRWVRITSGVATASTSANNLGWWAQIPVGTFLPAGATLDVTGAQPEMGTTVSSYFDGNIASGLYLIPSWTGTASDSQSILKSVEPRGWSYVAGDCLLYLTGDDSTLAELSMTGFNDTAPRVDFGTRSNEIRPVPGQGRWVAFGIDTQPLTAQAAGGQRVTVGLSTGEQATAVFTDGAVGQWGRRYVAVQQTDSSTTGSITASFAGDYTTGIFGVQYRLRGVVIAHGDTAQQALEAVAMPFDGNTAPDYDMTSDWTGAVHASPSVLSATRAMTHEGGFISTSWSASGGRSLRVLPRTTARVGRARSTVTNALIPVNDRVSIVARSVGQQITLGDQTATSTEDGQTISVEGEGLIVLGPGWWDHLMIGASPTYFDGDSPGAQWTGAVNASTSTFVQNPAPGTVTDEWLAAQVWRPIARDYRLHKGYVYTPPMAARFVKFEFTALSPQQQETLLPITRKVRLFPRSVVEAMPVRIAGGEALPPGVSTAIDLADGDAYEDALTTLRLQQYDPTSYDAVEALYADNPALAERLREVSWAYGFTPWHQGSVAPRFTQTQVHNYEIVEVAQRTKIGFVVGLHRVQAFTVDVGANDDTQMYDEPFHNFRQIESGFTWTFAPNMLTTGIVDPEIPVVATSKVYSSLHNVTGLQFATQQTEPVQVVPDDDFRDPALGAIDWQDNPDGWHATGDAVVAYSPTNHSARVARYSRPLLLPNDRSKSLVQDPINPVFATRDFTWRVPYPPTEGGIESGLIGVSGAGEIYVAVRATFLTEATSPLYVQVIDIETDEVLREFGLVGLPSEAIERYFSVDPGDAPAIRVRVVQKGVSDDVFEVDRLSVFDVGIVWEWSVDGGSTWVRPKGGVRNNARGIVTFPEPGNQLRWRVTGHRSFMAVNHLRIRPWYVGVQNARNNGEQRGANVSTYDSAVPVTEDPLFTTWWEPVPRDWFLAYRRLPTLVSGEGPSETEFARFYSRPLEETIPAPLDTALRRLLSIRPVIDFARGGDLSAAFSARDDVVRTVIFKRALPDTAPTPGESVVHLIIQLHDGGIVDRVVHPTFSTNDEE